jgi:hypothetical protein
VSERLIGRASTTAVYWTSSESYEIGSLQRAPTIYGMERTAFTVRKGLARGHVLVAANAGWLGLPTMQGGISRRVRALHRQK